MNQHDLKLKLATVFSGKETGVPVPILTEMLYEIIKKENPAVTRGSIRRIADANISILQATKKLYDMTVITEVK